MGKTKESKYGDKYNSSFYTTYRGFIVSKKALKAAKDRNAPTDSLLKSIVKNNPNAFAEKDTGASGIEKPGLFLEQLRMNNREANLTKIAKGKSELNAFGKELDRIQRTELFMNEEERISANFGKIMSKSMNQTEKNDLRKFLGWKKGYNLQKEGFTWNSEERRFEKTFVVDNTKLTKYVYINYQRKNKYSAGIIEYGVE